VSILDVHILGRALFFHAIGEQQREVPIRARAARPEPGGGGLDRGRDCEADTCAIARFAVRWQAISYAHESKPT
jgi:hypothetical protein